MSLYTYRIAQLEDVEKVHQFEIKKNFGAEAESIENKIIVWDSNYRLEALQHYFNLGWSFIAEDSQQNIVGFFMGQTVLFFDKQTQTLWIEYVSAIDNQIKTELIDIAYRLAREKHFQRVLLSTELQTQNLTKEFPFQNWERRASFLKTTK
jgi:hypothetical protein